MKKFQIFPFGWIFFGIHLSSDEGIFNNCKVTPTKGDASIAKKVATNYPGRASMSPILDLFITLLQMGKSTYRKLLEDQKENYKLLYSKLEELGERLDLKILRIVKKNFTFLRSYVGLIGYF